MSGFGGLNESAAAVKLSCVVYCPSTKGLVLNDALVHWAGVLKKQVKVLGQGWASPVLWYFIHTLEENSFLKGGKEERRGLILRHRVHSRNFQKINDMLKVLKVFQH